MAKPATIESVSEGSVIVADDGFTCIPANSALTVQASDAGLFVPCAHGRHYLDGQLDEGDDYIGFTVAK